MQFSYGTLRRQVWILFLIALFNTPGSARDYNQFDYSTTDAMRRDTKFVVREIQNLHYSRKSLSQIDFSEFLTNYIGDLDYNRLYFLQEDVDHYHMRFNPQVIRGKFARGDLYPAFQIFKDYRSRALERIDWVFDRLEGDFNFTRDDAYQLDRSESAWPASPEAADRLWTRRLKYELLNELLPPLMAAYEEQKTAATTADPEAPVEDVASPTSLIALLENPDMEEKVDEAVNTVRRRYERWRKNLLDLEPSYIQERYLTTFTNMYDPHSTFLSADSLEDFSLAMNNSFVGIGAMLEDDDGLCTIRELLPGGPAEQSRQLEPGDVILGVAQGSGEMVDVVDMNLRKIVKLIKGEKGTEVRLLIRPGDTADPSIRKVVSLIRDEIKLTANLASAEVFQVPSENRTIPIGVIDLPSFYGGNKEEFSSPTNDVKELVGKLKDLGIEGIILDLRRNGGGLLDEAIGLTGLFIPEGPVVQVRDTLGNIRARSDEDPEIVWKGPLMVLVSRYSASASEIVAGALQNHQRALVVGDTSTHGKGTVQAVVETNSRSLFPSFNTDPAGAAKITIQKFYLPNGDSTQKAGVLSDITIPSINEFLPVGEEDLENALVWDTIQPMDWDFASIEESDYAVVDDQLTRKLLQRSLDRQGSLAEFDYLQRSIDYYRKVRNQEEISLNLQVRQDRKESERSFQEQMEAELETLAGNPYPSEEILLDIRLEQEDISRQIQAASEAGARTLDQDPDTGRDPDADLPESPASDSETPAVESADAPETETEDPDRPFDIQLRESLRIMRDWIALESGENPSSTLTVQVDAKSGRNDSGDFQKQSPDHPARAKK